MKRSRVILLVGVVVVGLGGWSLLNHAREPRFNGQSVSFWLDQYSKEHYRFDVEESWDRQDALIAMRAIGNDAVPCLLREALVSKQNSGIRKAYYDFLEQFPESWKLPKRYSWQNRRNDAIEVLGMLSPPANFVLPQVQKVLEETSDLRRSLFIELCGKLGDGENAAPILIKLLNDPNPATQGYAVAALRDLGMKGKAAAPALINLFRQRSAASNHVDIFTLSALNQMGTNALPVVNDLKSEFMAATNWHVKAYLASSICQMDEHEGQFLEYLLNGVKTAESNDRRSFFIVELGRVGANALATTPSLLHEINTTNIYMRISVAETLQKIGADKTLFLPALEQEINSTNSASRYRAAEGVLQLDATNIRAQNVMLETIRSENNFSDAINELINAGSSAQKTLLEARQCLVDRLSNHGLPNGKIQRAIRHIDFVIKARDAAKTTLGNK